jgi:hypothetical protein
MPGQTSRAVIPPLVIGAVVVLVSAAAAHNSWLERRPALPAGTAKRIAGNVIMDLLSGIRQARS